MVLVFQIIIFDCFADTAKGTPNDPGTVSVWSMYVQYIKSATLALV